MAGKPHRARYTVHCDDAAEAEALCAALQVEVDDPLGGAVVRLVGPVAKAADRFVIEVEAPDLVHLRAASRSFLHWTHAAAASLGAARRRAPSGEGPA